jgi:hypothetical protein
MAVGSVIVRRVARSAVKAASATADAETTGPTERDTPSGQALVHTIAVRLRSVRTAVPSRLGAAGRAAWRELQHPDHGTRNGQDPAAPSARPPEETGTESKTGAGRVSAIADHTKTPWTAHSSGRPYREESEMADTQGNSQWNVAEWHSKMLVDRNGEKIGKLQDVYVDVETDEPQFATV